ncbi:hypothetical protein BAUCODRAFT_122230 [Baudoinia panamericana UAMH 10762]|uniref:Ribonuclease n=1 Tax=Baudoinia panamericana (strain UAMH 10762) TaxID=717646 RepID=M2MXB6_BAUPA|nr:uncharacterized protein BAUCODRAFT_122230 [Baudoinia panamericana UAMH 10762]EMC96198.1 hypothetical protein BAUCODRAFT_122230 [Baudoinia panamericana UAMH 10762]
MDDLPDSQVDSQDIADDAPVGNVFRPPSIHRDSILAGESYSHLSTVPAALRADMSTACVLGVDEAGRGPVLGPMVYALYYLPLPMHRLLLAETHHFDDSKALTPAVRSELMEKVCSPQTDLFQHCGWATRSMSARDISAAQLKANGAYNLNAQAMDATVDLIQQVLDLGVNVCEVYIDTIGPPATYQKRLERIFPSLSITVAKKADSLYPCVSAASVCAKVTRDASLDVLYSTYAEIADCGEMAWGSGYPSDGRCTTWLKGNMHPLFGWGHECRFSWGTAKEMLETKGAPCRIEWPEAEDATDNLKLTGFFLGAEEEKEDEMVSWFGKRVTAEVF